MRNRYDTCAISTCVNPNNVKYFKFPKDSDRRKLWLDKCCRADLVNVSSAKICEIHFTEDSFDRHLEHELLGLPLRRKLSSSAVPSLHLGFKEPVIKLSLELFNLLPRIGSALG